MIRHFYLTFLFGIVLGRLTLAQSPNISYQTPQIYAINTAIVPLSPTNTGGAVPATIYGKVTTFAGSGLSSFANGTGTSASFDRPYSSGIDASANLYVADYGNQMIRKITPGAVVSTFAGSGVTGSNNGPALSSSFNAPGGATVDVLGNVYIGDQTNNQIRKITQSGVVSTYAGNGFPASIDGSSTTASFSGPAGLIFDKSGNLYVADRNGNKIRKITPAGVVTTFAGSGGAGSVDGVGSSASFSNPTCVTVDKNDNIYVADCGNSKIRKITPAGVVTTFAGSGIQGNVNNTGILASFNQPFGLTVDAIGDMYVADEFNHLIRKISPAGVVTLIAGSGVNGGTDNIGKLASFSYPSGVISDGLGNLFVTESVGNKIRQIVITGYTIDKALPPGLTFDATTGIITGTPTSIFPATTYTITAYNTAGSSTTTVNIEVKATALLPQLIIFPPLGTVTYGSADITPLAVSTNPLTPITYTSSNTAVATITAGGKIHVTGVGQTTITASQAGDLVFSPATPVSQVLTVVPAVVNININNQTKVYGAANPVFTYTYSGFVNGESASVVTTQPTITTTAALSSPVGNGYTISGAGAVSPNYTFTYTTGTLTITPAPLLITANNQTRIYGINNPPLTLSYTGFITGDDASKLTTQATVVTTAIATSPTGVYPITVSGAVNANYTITYAPGNLTITVAPRTLTFNPITDKPLVTADFDPGATVNTGDPIVYTSSDPTVAVIVNGKIHLLKVGKVTITATVTSKTYYADVAPASQTFVVYAIDDLVRIPPVVTPNNDGINDVLRIDGIANYPDNRFTLVNINGVKIYEIDGYDNLTNVFDGHSNITGMFQPKGTYFYSLQFNVHGQKQRRVGYVVLKY